MSSFVRGFPTTAVSWLALDAAVVGDEVDYSNGDGCAFLCCGVLAFRFRLVRFDVDSDVGSFSGGALSAA